MRGLTAALTLSLLLGSTSLATAQAGRMAFGVKAGTLGLGAEASVALTRHLALRGGVNRFQLTRDQEIEGIDYQLTPRLQSFTALLDLHPFGGAFRLSSGLVMNRNQGQLAARPGQGDGMGIGDHEYFASEVQGLDGSITFKRSAPYVGLGFDNALTGSGRVSFNLELGVMFHGQPRANLSGRSTLTGDARQTFEQDVRLEAEEIQGWLDGLPRAINYYPVVAFGIKVRA
jgi:hypothetical protein